MSVHTIFIPRGWSIEQVWEVLKRGEKLTVSSARGTWVNVDDNGKLIK